MQGYCKKGDNCNFYHPPKEKEIDFPEQKPKAKKNYKKEAYKYE